jgi:uncharacterized membrane protein required for colicin V production
MLIGILKQFRWVDIVLVILFLRILYIAFKTGFPVEIFKLLGTVFAIYISLHYYTFFSDWIMARVPSAKENVPLEFLDFVSFLGLVIASYLLWVLLRLGFYRVVKVEAVPQVHKWGGLVFGLARAYLLTGLIVFILVISSIDYLKNSAGHAYLGKRLFKVAPNTYTWVWQSLVSKFIPKEKFNKTIPEVEKGFVQ